jgi:hypothetical protein
LPLVELMNNSGLMQTFASCHGHGFPFIYLTPYVAFKSCQSVAFYLDKQLREELISDSRRLIYQWELMIQFDDEGSLNYQLCAPGILIGSVRYATRKKINRDIGILCLITQKAFDHIHRQDIEIKPEENNQYK